jgi:hypothetical protein
MPPPAVRQVEWPLTEVLHARAMATYSAVWRTLLRVRRAGVTVSSAWRRLASLSRSLHCTARAQARSPLADVHAGRLRRVQLFVAEATHFHRLMASFFTTQLLGVRTPPARPAHRTHLSLGQVVRAGVLRSMDAWGLGTGLTRRHRQAFVSRGGPSRRCVPLE